MICDLHWILICYRKRNWSGNKLLAHFYESTYSICAVVIYRAYVERQPAVDGVHHRRSLDCDRVNGIAVAAIFSPIEKFQAILPSHAFHDTGMGQIIVIFDNIQQVCDFYATNRKQTQRFHCIDFWIEQNVEIHSRSTTNHLCLCSDNWKCIVDCCRWLVALRRDSCNFCSRWNEWMQLTGARIFVISFIYCITQWPSFLTGRLQLVWQFTNRMRNEKICETMFDSKIHRYTVKSERARFESQIICL